MLDLIIPRVVVSDNTSIAQSYIIVNIIVFVRTTRVYLSPFLYLEDQYLQILQETTRVHVLFTQVQDDNLILKVCKSTYNITY